MASWWSAECESASAVRSLVWVTCSDQYCLTCVGHPRTTHLLHNLLQDIHGQVEESKRTLPIDNRTPLQFLIPQQVGYLRPRIHSIVPGMSARSHGCCQMRRGRIGRLRVACWLHRSIRLWSRSRLVIGLRSCIAECLVQSGRSCHPLLSDLGVQTMSL